MSFELPCRNKKIGKNKISLICLQHDNMVISLKMNLLYSPTVLRFLSNLTFFVVFEMIGCLSIIKKMRGCYIHLEELAMCLHVYYNKNHRLCNYFQIKLKQKLLYS